MDLSYIKAFINSTIEIVNSLAALKVSFNENDFTKANKTLDENQVVLQINGDVKGKVIFSFPDDFLYKLANKISIHTLGAQLNFKEDSDSLVALLQELGNEISGQAITLLSISSLNCNISVPEVILKSNNSEMHSDSMYELSLKLSTEIGAFTIFLTSIDMATRNPAVLMVNLPNSLVENVAITYITKGVEVFSSYTFEETSKLLEDKLFDFVIIDIDRLTVNFKDVWKELLNKSQNKQIHLFIISARNQEQAYSHISPVVPSGYLYKYDSDLQVIDALHYLIEKVGFKIDSIKKHIKVRLPKDSVYTEVMHPSTKEMLQLSLKDISLVGMACYVHSVIDDSLKEKDILNDIRMYIHLKDYFFLKGEIVAINKNTQSIVIRFKDLSEKAKKDLALFIFRCYSSSEHLSVFKETYKKIVGQAQELLIEAKEKIMNLDSSILFITKELHLAKLIAQQLAPYGIKTIHEENIFKSLIVVKKNYPKIVLINNQIPKNQVYSFLARLRHDMGVENLPTILTIDEKIMDKVEYSSEELNKLSELGVTEVVNVTDKYETFVKNFTNDTTTPMSKYGKSFFDSDLSKKMQQQKLSKGSMKIANSYELFLKDYKTVIKIDGILSEEKVKMLQSELVTMKNLTDFYLEYIIKLDHIPSEFFRPKTIPSLFPFLKITQELKCPVKINIIHNSNIEKLRETLKELKDFPQFEIFMTLEDCMNGI